jgi:hypothetical protein
MGWKAMGDLIGPMAFLFPKSHRGNLMAFLFLKIRNLLLREEQGFRKGC